MSNVELERVLLSPMQCKNEDAGNHEIDLNCVLRTLNVLSQCNVGACVHYCVRGLRDFVFNICVCPLSDFIGHPPKKASEDRPYTPRTGSSQRSPARANVQRKPTRTRTPPPSASPAAATCLEDGDTPYTPPMLARPAPKSRAKATTVRVALLFACCCFRNTSPS